MCAESVLIAQKERIAERTVTVATVDKEKKEHVVLKEDENNVAQENNIRIRMLRDYNWQN